MPPKFDNNESRLGTKEYWDEHYAREIANFEATGDEGEIWFGEQSERKILKFVADSVRDASDVEIVELGCGNGSLLRKLRERGYACLEGVDYSAKALELAQKACESNEESKNDNSQIRFHLADLTAPTTIDENLRGRFDCVIDKGTWDAIVLSSADSQQKADRLQNYRRAIIQLFRRSKDERARFFIIVSCNFTRQELKDLFECESLGLYEEFPPTSSITFGGKTGTTFTGVVFAFRP